jgi:polysaccharide biosynthesis protein PslH
MKILFLSTWFPYPLDTGAQIRVYHLLNALARRHEVRLVSFLSDEQARRGGSAFLPTLEAWGVKTQVVNRDPFWRDPLKARLGHLSLQPRDAVAGYSAPFAACVRVAAQEGHDAVICSGTEVIGYAPDAPGPRLLEEHNFMTGWMEEQYRRRGNGPAALFAWITWQKCLRYERQLYPLFDGITMVSERDRQAVTRSIPEVGSRTVVVPNGVDIERNRPGLTIPEPDTLVFNGALTYHANADAMRYFCATILPAIRAERPGVRLRITGRYDGVDVSGIRGIGGVTLTGFLDDVRPAVAESCACVVPLREGGGTRLKILEAMALGTPVIATSKGAEGLDVTHERNILIADEPADFARQTLRVLVDPDLRSRLAAAGSALVEAKYGWEQIGERFCGLVESVVERANAGKRATAEAMKVAWNGTPR